LLLAFFIRNFGFVDFRRKVRDSVWLAVITVGVRLKELFPLSTSLYIFLNFGNSGVDIKAEETKNLLSIFRIFGVLRKLTNRLSGLTSRQRSHTRN
jgi:hypothetical protein